MEFGSCQLRQLDRDFTETRIAPRVEPPLINALQIMRINIMGLVENAIVVAMRFDVVGAIDFLSESVGTRFDRSSYGAATRRSTPSTVHQ